MGARGPLKLPATHLRAVSEGEVSGTIAAAARRLAPAKPAVVAVDSELDELWDSLVGPLDEAGLISPMDGPTLEAAVRHVALMRKAYTEVSEAGAVTLYDDKIAGGAKKHPAETVFRSESEMFLRYAQQLGMTLVSRLRTPSVKGEGDGEPNPFGAPAASNG